MYWEKNILQMATHGGITMAMTSCISRIITTLKQVGIF
jgi:hypothetical protein